MIRRRLRPARITKPLDRREPTPADWGIGVTVCVAAFNLLEHAIVFSSDTMTSFPTPGIEETVENSMVKVANIGRSWIAMAAGATTPVWPILRRVRAVLAPEGEPIEFSVKNVQDTFKLAYQQERLERAVDSHLSPYGLTVEEFNERGLEICGEKEAAAIREAMLDSALGCEFLVCGYDDQRRPHIFVVRDPGVVDDHDPLGYWAIGSGQNRALGAFVLREHSMRAATEHLIYNVCEAKFAAEVAGGVGVRSITTLWRPNLKRVIFSDGMMAALRNVWETYGKPRPVGADMTNLAEWVRDQHPHDPNQAPPPGDPWGEGRNARRRGPA